MGDDAVEHAWFAERQAVADACKAARTAAAAAGGVLALYDAPTRAPAPWS
jgi:hypothetical protein